MGTRHSTCLRKVFEKKNDGDTLKGKGPSMASSMSYQEIFTGFLIALAAGGLIGLERQQDRAESQKPSIGGVRTFPLIALAGALSALASHRMGVWPIVGGLLIVGTFLAVSYSKDWSEQAPAGLTTPIAALITYWLGVLALHPNLPLDTAHRYLLIVASAAVVMALLSFKEPLHRVITYLSDDDIYATAKFVILVLVVLPLLPDRTFDPLEVLNPFHIGLMVVLVAGISFLGYMASRWTGPNAGLLATGLLGGLISSTAVTVSMARHARQSPSLTKLAALATLAASTTMFLRTLVLIAILNITLIPLLLWPLGIMTVVGYVFVFVLSYTSGGPLSSDTVGVSHRNPFELSFALKFGLLYAVVLFVAKAAQGMLGDTGLYASSLVAGATDVDAISLSMVRFHKEGLGTDTAVLAITLAAMSNTVVKTLLALGLGGFRLAKDVVPGMALILAAGGAATAWMMWP